MSYTLRFKRVRSSTKGRVAKLHRDLITTSQGPAAPQKWIRDREHKPKRMDRRVAPVSTEQESLVIRTKPKGIVPPGTHVVTVLTAENQRVPWRRSPENPVGDVLTLRVSAGHEYRLIYTDLPIDKPALLAIVAASFGIAAQDMQPEKLKGRTATVEIAHVRTRRGLNKPIVQAWLPLRIRQEPLL